MEDLYDKIPYRILHLVQINQTVLFYEVFDQQGELMANWTMDSLIKTIQKFYHKSYVKHSAHKMTMNKASQIIQEEYSCLLTIQMIAIQNL